ncbi:MAG TPA: CHAP domain-containing protein [Candidatus Dormibacteraeota bacterium]|nr:CHAP domain-containing protein [Candidatus Dormibacteraeota bacterium]
MILAACGLLIAGWIAAARNGIQTVSTSASYWPAPSTSLAGQYYDKPAAVPGTIQVAPAPVVSAPAGATLATLATQYQTTPEELAWSNRLTAGAQITSGQDLLIPPAGPTVLVRVLPGETLGTFAARFRVSPGVVLNYNALSSGTTLASNSFLLMPSAASPTSLPAQDFLPRLVGVPEVTPTRPEAVNPFPWGQCTYWVASQRYVPWSGNAINWWANARTYGEPEGQVPVVGAIAVFDNGYLGHVAYVTKVLPNGSWEQSEMNVGGVGVEDTRTIAPNIGYFVGFIY